MGLDDNLPVMLWSAGPDMACEYLSPSWVEFTGFPLEQALGDGWARVVHPEDLARWLDACIRAFDAREPFEIEYRLRRRDGEYRWILDRGVPRHARDGLFLGYAGVCFDIDDRKRSEEESRRLQNRIIRDLLELSRDPVLAGVRVLVVDDDAATRDSLLKVLRIAGAETRSAASSAEALAALGPWRPDVLLSDLGPCLRAAALAPPAGDAQLAKPVEPVALLATVVRLAGA